MSKFEMSIDEVKLYLKEKSEYWKNRYRKELNNTLAGYMKGLSHGLYLAYYLFVGSERSIIDSILEMAQSLIENGSGFSEVTTEIDTKIIEEDTKLRYKKD